jgi:hypothetical protein
LHKHDIWASYTATSHRKIDWKWMARKLITYHLSPFVSFKTHGSACVARLLHDCKERSSVVPKTACAVYYYFTLRSNWPESSAFSARGALYGGSNWLSVHCIQICMYLQLIIEPASKGVT